MDEILVNLAQLPLEIQQMIVMELPVRKVLLEPQLLDVATTCHDYWHRQLHAEFGAKAHQTAAQCLILLPLHCRNTSAEIELLGMICDGLNVAPDQFDAADGDPTAFNQMFAVVKTRGTPYCVRELFTEAEVAQGQAVTKYSTETTCGAEIPHKDWQLLLYSLCQSISHAQAVGDGAVDERYKQIVSRLTPRILHYISLIVNKDFTWVLPTRLKPLVKSLLDKVAAHVVIASQLGKQHETAMIVGSHEYLIRWLELTQHYNHCLEENLVSLVQNGCFDAARVLCARCSQQNVDSALKRFAAMFITASDTVEKSRCVIEMLKPVLQTMNSFEFVQYLRGNYQGIHQGLETPIELNEVQWETLRQCFLLVLVGDPVHETIGMSNAVQLLADLRIAQHFVARGAVVTDQVLRDSALSLKNVACVAFLRSQCTKQSDATRLIIATRFGDAAALPELIASTVLTPRDVIDAMTIAVDHTDYECASVLVTSKIRKLRFPPKMLQICVERQNQKMTELLMRLDLQLNQLVWSGAFSGDNVEFLRWFSQLARLPAPASNQIFCHYSNKSREWIDAVGEICRRFNMTDEFRKRCICQDFKTFMRSQNRDATLPADWMEPDVSPPRIRPEYAKIIMQSCHGYSASLMVGVKKHCLLRFSQLLHLLQLPLQGELLYDWQNYSEGQGPCVTLFESTIKDLLRENADGELPETDRILMLQLMSLV